MYEARDIPCYKGDRNVQCTSTFISSERPTLFWSIESFKRKLLRLKGVEICAEKRSINALYARNARYTNGCLFQPDKGYLNHTQTPCAMPPKFPVIEVRVLLQTIVVHGR